MKPFVLLSIGVVLGMVMIAAPVTHGDDWPQFMGPNRDGTSPEQGLARTWPAGGPKVLWSAPLGEGYGAPSVRDGEVYVLDRAGDKQDVLRCFSFETGQESWSYAYDAPGEVSHDGSRTPPTIDEARVYSVGMLGHFYCFDRKTHKPLWNHNLTEDFKQEVPMWGISQAPALYKDLVIVAPQSPEAAVAAYKQDTGELVWKTPLDLHVGYSTPVLTTLAGVEQVVASRGMNGGVMGLSPDTGAVLWSYTGWQCKIPIPYPMTLPGDRLFITGGYRAGSAMIQVVQENGAFTSKELFKLNGCGSQIPQPLFYKDHIYLNTNTNEREDGLACLSLDGKILWKTSALDPKPAFDRGSIILVDNLIISLGKDGVLRLIEPSPDQYKELTSATLFSGKEIWAPLVFSQGRLLVRNQEEMKCLDLIHP